MESSPPHTPVRPVAPAMPYLGGKRNLAKRLVTLIEATPHRTYAEVFTGAGGVFLRRRLRPQSEVINDLSRDIWSLYKVLQVHYVPFMDMLRYQVTSREEFERLVVTNPEALTDMQRAARFLYLQRVAFGGKITGRSFGVSLHRPGRFDVTKLESVLLELSERLAGVVIERLDWAEFLKRYDSPETLFYLDPPYWGCEGDYGEGMFDLMQFAQMATALKALKGRFILSLNDVRGVRDTFRDFRIEAVDTHYGIAGKGAELAAEVIITAA